MELFPPIEPYHVFNLAVSGEHVLYVEESGNPEGIPIVRIHGGPGDRAKDHYRQLYDPQKRRIICYDQRGCGQSQPTASLINNTTDDLICDLELIREHLDIHSWVVHGASWGTTLALLYAQEYPNSCKSLLLNNIFLATEHETDSVFVGKYKDIFPELWDNFVAKVPRSKQDDIKEFISTSILDGTIDMEMFQAFLAREYAHLKYLDEVPYVPDVDQKIDKFKVFFHYIARSHFLDNGVPLDLDSIDRVRAIPTTIIHSRYDLCCPFGDTAYKLHQARPQSRLEIVEGAGHRTSEFPIQSKVMERAERFAHELS